MNQMTIETNHLKTEELYIQQNNYLFIHDYQTFYYFYASFQNLGKENNRVTLGEKVLDPQNTVVINLMDYHSIFLQCKIEKGSLSYEYLIQELEEQLNDHVEIFNDYFKMMFKPAVDYSILSYETNFNFDIKKLISTFSYIRTNDRLEDFQKQVIKLLQEYQKRNLKKTIIVFINDLILPNIEINTDKIIVFHTNHMMKHNLIIDNQIYNYDYDMLIEYFKTNWPLYLDTEVIKKIYNQFLKIYYNTHTYEIEEILIYTVAYLFCKIINIPMNYKFTGQYKDIDNPYKKFIEINEI